MTTATQLPSGVITLLSGHHPLLPARRGAESLNLVRLACPWYSSITVSSIEVTVLMPCLNEAATVARCIDKAKRWLDASGTCGEIVVADNGSTDGSREIAQARGARLVAVDVRGYGAALRGGLLQSRGIYVVMGDADDSYDFADLGDIVAELRSGADLVVGNRFAGSIDDGAMPWLHRYVGNPVLSFIARRLFHSRIRDFHCGLRGCRRESLQKLDLRSLGMEYASEMVIKAELAGLRITQVPVALHVDGRGAPPHLNTWRDGWRHLRLLMVYAPQQYFLFPGGAALTAGALAEFALAGGPIRIGPVRFAVGTLLVAMLFCLMGAEILFLGIATRDYALRNAYLDLPRWRYGSYLTTKTIAGAGLASLVVGGIDFLRNVVVWDSNALRHLSIQELMGGVVPAVTLLLIGVTAMFAVFMSVLDEPVGRMSDSQLLSDIELLTAADHWT